LARQISTSKSSQAAWRAPRAASRRAARSRGVARVVVDWSSPLTVASGAVLAPLQLELEAAPQGTALGTWKCRELSTAGWVEAISSAQCTEVVLTARLGDDGPARHLVLELAELLTQKLAATQPLIRVRFLPHLPA
jgi:hypothetical protein